MNMFPDHRNLISITQELSFLGSGQVFLHLAVALICGLLIALFYRWACQRSDYSTTFVNSLVALSMITTLVITVIGNNLARAFGLVGALSIIRFRLAVRDIQDIVFIFFALAMGMAAGVGLLLTAAGGTVLIGIIIVLLSQIRGASPRGGEFLLRFSFTPSGEPGEAHAPYRPILENHCKQHELIRVKPSKSKDSLAVSFSIVLKSDTGEHLARELGLTPGVSRVVLTKGGHRPRKRRKSRSKSSIGWESGVSHRQ